MPNSTMLLIFTVNQIPKPINNYNAQIGILIFLLHRASCKGLENLGQLGGPQFLLLLESYYFCDLEPHAKFQNPMTKSICFVCAC